MCKKSAMNIFSNIFFQTQFFICFLLQNQKKKKDIEGCEEKKIKDRRTKCFGEERDTGVGMRNGKVMEREREV